MKNIIATVVLSLGACGLVAAADSQPETPQNTSVQPADQAQVNTSEKNATKTTPKTPDAKTISTPQTGQIVDPKANHAKPATDPKEPGEKRAEATPPTNQPRMTEPLKPSDGSQGPQLDRSSSSPRLIAGEQLDTTPKIKSTPEELKQRTDMSSTKNDTEIKKENPIR